MEARIVTSPVSGSFRIEVDADFIEPGKIPVRDLKRITELVQDGLERTARLLTGDRGVAPGPLPKPVLEATELLLVGVESGSAVLALELPSPKVEPEAEDLRLVPLPSKDLGFRAMERFVAGLRQLSSTLGSAVPRDWDNSVMEVAESLSVFAQERGISMTLDAWSPMPGKRVTARITPDLAPRFRIRHAPVKRRRTARGQLIAVDLGTGRVDVLDTQRQRVHCEFSVESPETAAVVRQLLGRNVVVSGEEEFDAASQKSGRLEIESLEPASEETPLAEAFWMNPSAAEQALEQGVWPIESVAVLARPDLFTEEEIDSFIRAIREAGEDT
jgi:hypothetical protein